MVCRTVYHTGWSSASVTALSHDHSNSCKGRVLSSETQSYSVIIMAGRRQAWCPAVVESFIISVRTRQRKNETKLGNGWLLNPQ